MSEQYKGPKKVIIGSGESLPINHVGKSLFPTLVPKKFLLLNDMLHVPSIIKNLMSISSLIDNNDVVVEFNGNSCCVKDKRMRKVLLRREINKGLFKINEKYIVKVYLVLSVCS